MRLQLVKICPLKEVRAGGFFQPTGIPDQGIHIKIGEEQIVLNESLHKGIQQQIQIMNESLKSKGFILGVDIIEGAFSSYEETLRVEWYDAREAIELNLC